MSIKSSANNAAKNASSSYFWENRYKTEATGWDLGNASPPIKAVIDDLKDKDIAILIPGCGNAYEAEYLLKQGFTNLTIIDFAPTVVQKLKDNFEHNKNIRVLLGNFFEHVGTYDLILEQTFFCALPPNLRQRYVWKMHQLLAKEGRIAGLLFNRSFESGPPFGGDLIEYQKLFTKSFFINKLHLAENSVPNRANTELIFEFKKNDRVNVNLFCIENCCDSTIEQNEKFQAITGAENVSINIDNSEVLIVSNLKTNVTSFNDTFFDVFKMTLSVVPFVPSSKC